jgi:site-specific DNA-methyltransferase (adenine-specific)
VLFAEKDGTQAHAQITAFEDTWTWDLEAAAEYAEVLNSGHDRVAKCLKGMHDFLGSSDMLAYLSMMAIRLIELRRECPEPTGSIYLHCDPPLPLPQAVDGRSLTERYGMRLSGERTTGQALTQFGRVHDVILFLFRNQRSAPDIHDDITVARSNGEWVGSRVSPPKPGPARGLESVIDHW